MRPLTPLPKYLVILGAWTAFALFMLVQSYVYRTRSGAEIDLPVLLVREFSYAYIWAALTPLILRLGDRFRIEREKWKRSVAIHLVTGAALAVVHKIVSGTIDGLFGTTRGDAFSWETQFRGVLAYFDYGILVYWIVLLMKYAVDYYRWFIERDLKNTQLEAQLARSQLQALRMQLNPHFLFNTLNAISVLIGKDPEGARKTIVRLSDLLRTALDTSTVAEVPLRTELEFVDRYLQIEKTRFGERLTVSYGIEDDVLDASVPTMLLQPLVENAIKHGINRNPGPGILEITARRMNGWVRLGVRDNGVGFGSEGASPEGVGLANTRARLQNVHGDRYRLDLTKRDDGGMQVTIDFPFQIPKEQGEQG
jgi:signal transduction histidine kinase